MKADLKEVAYEQFEIKYGKWNQRLFEQLNIELNLAKSRRMTNQIILTIELVEYFRKNQIVYHAAGATASSFLFYILGISKTNPLSPHYYCPNCNHIEFDSSVLDGFDLPERRCSCGTLMFGDGHNIDSINFWGQKFNNEWHNIWIAVSSRGFNECFSFLLNHPLIKGKSTYRWFNDNEVRVGELLLLKSDALDNFEPTQIIMSNEKIKQFAFDSYVSDYSYAISDQIVESWFRYDYMPETFHDAMSWYGISHGTWNFDNKNRPVTKLSKIQDVVNEQEALRIGDMALEMKTLFCEIPTFYDDVYQLLIKSGVEKDKAFEIARKAHYGRADEKEIFKYTQNRELSQWIAGGVYMFPKAHALEFFLTLYGCRLRETPNHK